MRIAITERFLDELVGLGPNLARKCRELIRELQNAGASELSTRALPGWRLHKLRNSPFVSVSRRSLVEFSTAIAAGMRRMYLSGRSNELLSVIYKHGLPCPYDIPTLLRALLKKNDFPGFLKQASRFEVYRGFEAEIQQAIESLRYKNQQGPADAYQRRFDELRGRCSEP